MLYLDSYRDAKRYLDKFKRVDIAVDAYYNGDLPPSSTPKTSTSQPSTSKLNALFDQYKGGYRSKVVLAA